LSSRQIAEWMAWFQRHPFGQDHTDLLLAQLTAVIDNRLRSKGDRSSKPKDFLPFERNRPQSTEEIKHTLRGILYGSRRES
jgi:hypothetical protein